MDEARWQRADELFSEALELPSGERAAFVAGEARGDEELEALVHRLLRHAEESPEELAPGLPLGTHPGRRIMDSLADEALPPGTRVGRYRLLEELGRGGMAVVYRAERVDGDFEQEVALKQILGPASSELVRRLEQERQILARASHPDVARLLDGGMDAEGRPFLVLELVAGIPIDQYCDRERLALPERLKLFLRIARAVQYAHRNLVVHRDIKPSNTLVTDEGHPKLLDFGIARLLGGPEAELGLTGQGVRPMTPAYASPEQIRSEPVTTLSDVYQLGLLLYLLLTGRRPYRQESTQSPLELARAITEEPPTHPRKVFLEPPTGGSAREATDAEEIARRRRTSPSRLARQLQGDLGAIVLMALRKEPERRYPSVDQMIEDIQRFLSGRTVNARPSSLGYRFRTFSRRHRFAVLFATLLAISLVAFSAVSALQARRVAAERDRANQEAEVARQVSSFLTDIFEVSDPGESRGNTVTAREILDQGRQEIDRRMPEPSLVRARLKGTMGQVYENLGLLEAALPLYESAFATARQMGGDGSPEEIAARADLARLLMRLVRYEESEGMTLSALADCRRLLGEEHPETLDLEANLAALRFMQGKAGESEAMHRRILEARRRVQGPDHPDSLAAANALASNLFYRGSLEEAEALYREILDGLRRTLGGDHPRTLKAASNLGSIWVQLRRFDEAEPLLRQTIAGREKVLGKDHPGTLNALGNLAGLLADRGDRAEAEDLYRQIYRTRLRTRGPEHRRTLDGLSDLAWVTSLDPDRRGQAVDLYSEVLAGYREALDADHPSVLDTLYSLAVLQAQRGRYELALARLEQAVERGYAGLGVLEEAAFEPLAADPRLQALRQEVRRRLEAAEEPSGA